MRKIPFAGIELTSQRVRRLQGYLYATGATGSKYINTTVQTILKVDTYYSYDILVQVCSLVNKGFWCPLDYVHVYIILLYCSVYQHHINQSDSA